MRGAGRVVFTGILLIIVGTINIIYGIGALDDASIFVNDTRFILDNLNTLGWVLIILGVIQLTGGFSLLAGTAHHGILSSARILLLPPRMPIAAVRRSAPEALRGQVGMKTHAPHPRHHV